ncbi:protein kinase (macronuclear) [Tetrahymena thermophila SB210]|uniref:Protein kinase n=1 Tax=Tetrahymena thermophila (strain SB210) TaxID=312017 RepID=Q23BR5_TETTS|nr:protein kinase [Tetrahymena thermophila SB210]EAR94053.2 protein kinase [Tetrahymena thermophila SB210]|eukprot:XP_001014298.2 protein kinase [Tetrahymena thermophila SB210]
MQEDLTIKKKQNLNKYIQFNDRTIQKFLKFMNVKKNNQIFYENDCIFLSSIETSYTCQEYCLDIKSQHAKEINQGYQIKMFNDQYTISDIIIDTAYKRQSVNQKFISTIDNSEEIKVILEEHNLDTQQQNELINIINRIDTCFQNNIIQVFQNLQNNNYILEKLLKAKKTQMTFHGYHKLDKQKQKQLLFIIEINQKSQDVKQFQMNAIQQKEKEKQIIILERYYQLKDEFYLFVLFKENYLKYKQAIKQCIQKEIQAVWSIQRFFEGIQDRLDVLSRIKNLFEKILNQLVYQKIYLIDYKKEELQVYHFNGFQQVSNEFQDIVLLMFLGKFNIEEFKRCKDNYEFLGQKINRKIIIDQIQFGLDMQILVLNKNNKKLVEIKKNMQMDSQKMIDQVIFNFNTVNCINDSKNQINSNWFNKFQNEIFTSLLDKQYFLCRLIKQESQILMFDGYQETNSRFKDLTFKVYYQRENKLIDKEFFIINYYQKKLKDKKILLDYLQITNDLNILALDKQEYNNFQADIKRDLENQDIQIWDKQKFKQQINQALKNKKTFQKQFDKILDQLIQKNYYLSNYISDSDKQEENLQFFTGYQMRSLSQNNDLIFQMQHEIDNQKLHREQNIIEMIEVDCQEQIKQDYFKFEENIHVTIFKQKQYQQIKDKIEDLKNNKHAFIFDLQKVYQQLKSIKELKNHQILFTQWETISKSLKQRKYFINSYISQGGFSIVLEGYKQISLGKCVGVIFKFIIEESKIDIQNEIDIMNRVNQHQNIIKLLDHFSINDSLQVLVLEKCRYSLRDELNQQTDKVKIIQSRVKQNEFQDEYNPFGVQKLMKIFSDLLDGLIEMRSHRIIHSDIKPSNILIKDNLDYVYCDFGVSLIIQDDSQRQPLGYTIIYACPEALNLNTISFKSDVYSLGKTFREVLRVYNKLNNKTQFIMQIEKIINENMVLENASDRYDCLKLHQLFFDSIKYLDDNANKFFLEFYQKKIFKLVFIHPLSVFDFYKNKDFTFIETAQKHYYKIRKKILFMIHEIQINLLNKKDDIFILKIFEKVKIDYQYFKKIQQGKFLKKIVNLVTQIKLKLKKVFTNFNQMLLGWSKRYNFKTQDNFEKQKQLFKTKQQQNDNQLNLIKTKKV